MSMDALTDGQTPLDPDEVEGLIPSYVRTRQELNEWEQANIASAIAWLSQRRRRNPVLSLSFLRELHRRMFGKTWRWAGKFRTSGKTIGIPADQITEAVYNLLEDTKEQVKNRGSSADEIAVRFHHGLVRIHPFPNGNGRLVVVLNASNRSASIGPFLPFSAFCNFSHADRSGKNACVMQNVCPS